MDYLFTDSFIFTWYCASSKYIEAVQQNCEVDLKTHRIVPYGELLEDLSLEQKEDVPVIPSIAIEWDTFNRNTRLSCIQLDHFSYYNAKVLLK